MYALNNSLSLTSIKLTHLNAYFPLLVEVITTSQLNVNYSRVHIQSAMIQPVMVLLTQYDKAVGLVQHGNLAA